MAVHSRFFQIESGGSKTGIEKFELEGVEGTRVSDEDSNPNLQLEFSADTVTLSAVNVDPDGGSTTGILARGPWLKRLKASGAFSETHFPSQVKAVSVYRRGDETVLKVEQADSSLIYVVEPDEVRSWIKSGPPPGVWYDTVE